MYRNVRQIFDALRRRSDWFIDNLTWRKLLNIGTSIAQYAGSSEKLLAWPPVVKIDITPLCNLRCTWCVHSRPNGNPRLEKQDFHRDQLMSLDQYRRIIEEIRGKASAVSLFYLGDPLQHPDLDAICRITADARLAVQVSTNFSQHHDDDRIRRLVQSGLTDLRVCVDGINQQTYERTRVGGRIDLVLSNLERVCRFRRELGQTYPYLEVQYLKYQHNLDELEVATRRLEDLGVDRVFSDDWGSLHNQTDLDPGMYSVFGPRKRKFFPQCVYPFFSTVIKYDGDVIPCCTFREGMQYTKVDDRRVLGNVFRTSFKDVWNAPAYRDVRRFCANPQLIESDPSLRETFCYGCPRLFETDRSKNRRPGTKYRFEEIYKLDERGRPVRISSPEPVPEGQCAVECNVAADKHQDTVP